MINRCTSNALEVTDNQTTLVNNLISDMKRPEFPICRFTWGFTNQISKQTLKKSSDRHRLVYPWSRWIMYNCSMLANHFWLLNEGVHLLKVCQNLGALSRPLPFVEP